MSFFYKPIVQNDSRVSDDAYFLAGTSAWFNHVDVLERKRLPKRIHVDHLPKQILKKLTQKRQPVAGLRFEKTLIMGILNVTPDSFSDGGMNFSVPAAVKTVKGFLKEGVDIIDIGGESTRPGADTISIETELSRVVPIIEAVKELDSSSIVSVDTRSSHVMSQAIEKGADLINDVSALTHDSFSRQIISKSKIPVCLMHGGQNPKKMQDNVHYDDVLLDVFEYLEQQIEKAKKAGIDRSQIIIDPGIGFGKLTEHDVKLVKNISLFHSLGVPILMGASRKKFIGNLASEPLPSKRLPGSLAAALEGVRQGVQILRVHDVAQTKQAVVVFKSLSI